MWLSLCVHKIAHGSCVARAQHCFFVFECAKLKLVSAVHYVIVLILCCFWYAQNPNMLILYTVLFTARVSNNTGLSEDASSFYNIEILKNENIKSQREKLHPDFYFHWLKTDQFTVDCSQNRSLL